jgi:phage tail P2-like protein
LWSAQDCPEALLPWLAWSLSIDQWDAAWPLAVRRQHVATAIEVQRAKGTIRSIELVIAALGGRAVMREWFETTPRGDPHTFTVTVALSGADGAAPDVAMVNTVIAEIEATKPLRSHFEFVLAVNAAARIGLRGVARPAIHARIQGTAPSWDIPSNAVLFGGFVLTLGGDALTIGS